MKGGPLISCELINLSRAPRTYALRALFVALLACATALAWPWEGRAREMRFSGLAVFHVFFWSSMVAANFLVPALVAPAIATERERHTLDLLSVSPLSEFEIVFGKLVSHSALVASILLASLPIGFAALLLGGVEPSRLLACVAHILVCGVFSSCLSIALSASCERAGLATGITMALMVVFVVASLILGSMVYAFVTSIFVSGPAPLRIAPRWFPQAAMHAVSPWTLYGTEAISPRAPAWGMRIAAWSAHLGAAWLCLVIARSSLRGSRSPKKHKPPAPKAILAPAAVPADGIPVAVIAPPPVSAAILPPDGIPVAWMEPEPAAAPAWASGPPLKSRLPVGHNPIVWKDRGFRGAGAGRTVFAALGAIGSSGILLFSLIVAAVSTNRPFLPIAWAFEFQLGLLVVVLVASAAGVLGPERAAGTLGLLVATGRPPAWILGSKLLAAIRGLWPLALVLLVHAIIVASGLGGAGVLVALAVASSGALALSVTAATSFLADRPRRAVPLALALLTVGWWACFGLAELRAELGLHQATVRFFQALNPFVLIDDVATHGVRDPVAALTAVFASAALAAALFGLTSLAVERRVRA